MAALRRRLDEPGLTPAARPGVAPLLDLVALGTVADVVPLDANNRVLVAQGLSAHPRRALRAGHPRAAGRRAARAQAELTAADLGFAVAPRLNAAGRSTTCRIGIRCLLADDAAERAGTGRAAGCS